MLGSGLQAIVDFMEKKEVSKIANNNGDLQLVDLC